MVEQAFLSVRVRKPGRTHSTIVIDLIDGSEIEILANNHDLIAVERNPKRAQLKVQCMGESDGKVPKGKVAIEMPMPHIIHGKRITVASKYVERPNPSKAVHSYDTRTFDVKDEN